MHFLKAAVFAICASVVSGQIFRSEHNRYRATHSAPALTIDDKLVGYAQTLVDSCKFAHNLTIGGVKYGQNIAVMGSSAPMARNDVERAMIKAWYNEVKDFSSEYGKTSPNMANFAKWGHFTQMVWKGTSRIGCAFKVCKKGTIFSNGYGNFIACNYQTPGNVGGAYAANVARPTTAA